MIILYYHQLAELQFPHFGLSNLVKRLRREGAGVPPPRFKLGGFSDEAGLVRPAFPES